MTDVRAVEPGSPCFLATGSAVVRATLLTYLEGEWAAFVQVAIPSTEIGPRGEMVVRERPSFVLRRSVYTTYEAADAAVRGQFVKGQKL